MNNIDKFVREIKVYDCADLTKIRIGNQHDGGYVAFKEFCAKTRTVYSFGIGDDVGFEIEFANMFPGVELKLFDPTINSLPIDHERLAFFKHGIGYDNEKFNIIRDVPDNSLLKIDVEWNEWEALNLFNSVLESHNPLFDCLDKFSQILIEFHIIHVEPRNNLSPYFTNLYQSIHDKLNENIFKLYYEVLKKLNSLFYIYHIHPNNSLPMVQIGNYSFPPLLEVSFVRKDLVRHVQEIKTTLPINGLDFPNKTDRPDILNWFPIIKNISNSGGKQNG